MKIGLISSPVPGHINPMSTLGRELKKRGHEIYFFNIEDTRKKIISEDLNFISIGNDPSEFPEGSWEKFWVPLSKRYGISVVMKTIKLHTKLSTMMVKEIPSLARELNLDALLIDQIQFQGKAIASLANLPFISVACALHMDKDQSLYSPPPISTRSYGKSFLAKLLNRIEWAILEWAAWPLIKTGNPALKSLGLPICKNADQSFSELAQIFPMSAAADFPGDFLSQSIHYVGPMIDTKRPQIYFDYSKLDGRPVIYASLGTLQNGMVDVYETIIKACEDLDVQLVLTLGQWRSNNELIIKKSSNAIIVEYAPQLEIISKASLVITHAGMNTAYETLNFGVPIIALPISNDQPAVARRLERIGVAKVIPISKLSVKKLRAAIQLVLTEKSFKENSLKFARESQNLGGAKKAAEIVEEKLQDYLCQIKK